MVLSEDLLLAYGATYENYAVNEIIFEADAHPRYYFQIVEGKVELNNYHLDGREFTQNILYAGQSIGDSILFTDYRYPMNAIARAECIILKLPRADFLAMVSQNPKAALSILKSLSDRLYYKYLMLFNLSAQDPEFKIITIMDYLKGFNSDDGQYSFQVPLTRQQIANLTGLRVETVIRTVKKMEKNKIVRIENGKILY